MVSRLFLGYALAELAVAGRAGNRPGRRSGARRPPPDYVDGEVIDATDVDSRAQPLRPGA
jgi:hypothetical protein